MTSPPEKHGKGHVELREGNSCLLSVMRQYFMVEIVEIGEQTLRLSFPGRDYPVEGMPVDLQFHDKTGFYSYPSVVVKGPESANAGIEVRKPKERRRAQHRDSCRIPTDLTVQIKDQVHVRRYNASLLNLSAGGALVQSLAPFDFTTTAEILLSLPGESSHTLVGQIVHIGDPSGQWDPGTHVFGVRFIDPDPRAAQSIARFLWQQLIALYPAE